MIDETMELETLMTKEMKKQLLRAETLVVQLKFEPAYQQPAEKLALSLLSTGEWPGAFLPSTPMIPAIAIS